VNGASRAGTMRDKLRPNQRAPAHTHGKPPARPLPRNPFGYVCTRHLLPLDRGRLSAGRAARCRQSHSHLFLTDGESERPPNILQGTLCLGAQAHCSVQRRSSTGSHPCTCPPMGVPLHRGILAHDSARSAHRHVRAQCADRHPLARRAHPDLPGNCCRHLPIRHLLR
ncbi:hypothetical protein AAVH_42860, partial [Aphelenchoides avenae]